MKKGWQLKSFETCIAPVEYSRKIQRKDFLDEGRFPIISQEAEFTNGYWNDDADVFRVSTPVVIFGDHTQVLKYVDFDFVLGADGVKILRPQDFLCPKFFFYQLRAVEMPTLGYARHYRLLKELAIAVPPLAEQQRIVGVLDEAFADLATAQAHAEKNLQNARALFESHLQSVFTRRGRNWERATLEALLERGWIESHLDGNHGSDYPRKEEFVSEGVPYISANCIRDDRVDLAKSKFLSPERAALLRKGIARNNDVLFAHNATVGPVAILRTTEAKVILGTSLTYYRCNPRHIIPEYLAHYMRSSEFTSQYSQIMKQSTRSQVPITKQREFFHIVPPVDEQERLVHALEGLFEATQRLTWLYDQKQSALAALKKSLLHQAFSGAL